MMIGIGTPRSQSKIPRPKLPSSCCVGANSVRAMNFEAPQFVPCEKGTFHACLLRMSPVSGGGNERKLRPLFDRFDQAQSFDFGVRASKAWPRPQADADSSAGCACG